MPRRPRPASRLVKSTRPDVSAAPGPSGLKAKAKSQRPLAHTDDEPDLGSDRDSDAESDDSGAPSSYMSPEEDQNVDAPRVAQWVDEDELDQGGDDAVLSEDGQEGVDEHVGMVCSSVS
jgi:ribosomal RNA-processing protein 36